MLLEDFQTDQDRLRTFSSPRTCLSSSALRTALIDVKVTDHRLGRSKDLVGWENVFVLFFSPWGIDKPEALAWLAYGSYVIQGLLGGLVYAIRK